MVSVAELLNPEPPRAPLPSSRPSALRSPPAGRPTAFRNEASTAAATRPPIEMLRMTENARGHSRSKTKGVVNYPPFEALDEASLVQVRRFQVHPFGSIQDTSERIPYNSGKKDFFSKTGREGFEVFRYDFRYKEKPEDDDITYTVMWDYNVGFVRMTPFFRCRGFPKTAPAKMLNSNPGLKEITHGITGGSIKAQGYWMPYSCAKAVCATFCAKIAGALIPLFGPRFPYECIPEGAPGYDRMLISQDIVNQARREAAALFGPRSALLSPRPSRSLSPQRPTTTTTTRIPEPAYADHDRRLLLSPYTDTTDTEYHYHPVSEPYYTRRMCPPAPRTTTRPAAAAIPPPPPTSAPTPQDSPTWAAHNRLPPSHPPPPPPPPQYPAGPAYHHRDISQLNEDLLGLNVSSTAHPWLSAVPRSPTLGRLLHHHHPCYSHLHHHQQTSPPTSTTSSTSSTREWNINLPPLRLKRRYEEQVDHPDVAGRENTSINTTNTTNRDTGGGSGGEAERRRSSHSSSPSSSSPSSTTTTVPDTPSTTTGTYHHPSWASGQHHPHHYLQHHQQDDDNHTSSPPPRTPPESTTTATATAATTSSERINSESTAPLPAETTTAKSGGGGARPAAERDVAIMLMQMRADSEKEEGGSSGGSSTSSTPSNSPGFLRGGRDGVTDREDREARGRDSASPPVLALHHRHHRYRHRRGEADDGEEGETTSSGRSTTTTTTTTTPPPTTTTTRTAAAGGGAGGGSGVEGDSINVHLVQTGGGDKRREKETEMERIVAARPTPSTPTPGSGPNTRAKRRRTSFGC